MRVITIVVMLILGLSGCSAPVSFEAVTDVWEQGELPEPRDMAVLLPSDATVQTMSGEQGVLYFCDGYEVAEQVFRSGDLSATLEEVTGYPEARLSVVVTDGVEGKHYYCAWTSTGETGDLVCRAVIVDDGNYHYCLTVMAEAEKSAGMQEVWSQILSTYHDSAY